jgi:hypothetical protein
VTDDQQPDTGWTDAALDRLRDALKAMPESKNEAGSNPSKEESRG